MRYKIKFFGTREDLNERLLDSGLEPERFFVKSYALDNTVSFEAEESEYREVCEALGDAMYSEEEVPLSSVLVDFLKENGLVMATAESCTGGLVSARIVDVPGASDVFYEGVVTYSNQAKVDRLDVNECTLEEYGAVSEQTAKEMVLGLISGNVDIAVSTTGIAGPGGGTEEKPVGLVYIGIAFREHEPVVEKRIYKGSRNEIRRCAANEAIFLTYKYLFDFL